MIPVGFPFSRVGLVVLDEGSGAVPRGPGLLLLGSDYTVTGGGYNGTPTPNQMQVGSISVVATGAGLVLANDQIVIMRGVPVNQTTSLGRRGRSLLA